MIRKKERKVYKIDYMCDWCKDGEMFRPGQLAKLAYDSDVAPRWIDELPRPWIREQKPRFLHACSKCKQTAWLEQEFPFTEIEYVETDENN